MLVSRGEGIWVLKTTQNANFRKKNQVIWTIIEQDMTPTSGEGWWFMVLLGGASAVEDGDAAAVHGPSRRRVRESGGGGVAAVFVGSKRNQGVKVVVYGGG
ncbi:hypothetical protein L1987_30524 [Smallanthus sonchifolius]|uniref:Uncharacterized protein n=1 Tax=Smallanthus sonchifolius TaxID=185202 RepID=A0ACB9I5Q5_9ASTR|nr:hypothetical protein L1987_30524 [Smallanthus sonchifolius]